MASARVPVAAATADALATLEIREVVTPSVVNFWAASVTNGDTVGLSLDRTSIFPTGEVNIEISADVIDTTRDQICFNTVVGRGLLRMPVGAVTTELQALLSVEPIL